MGVIEISGTSFLDVAFLACYNPDGGIGEVSTVVCQADGTWTRRPSCHPGLHPVTPEVPVGGGVGNQEDGPVTFDLESGRSRFRFRDWMELIFKTSINYMNFETLITNLPVILDNQ